MGRPKDADAGLQLAYASGIQRTAAALELIADELRCLRRLAEAMLTPSPLDALKRTPEWELRERLGTRILGDSTPPAPMPDNLAARTLERERLRNPGAHQKARG